MVESQKKLDLRYNDMWNDWDGTGETQEPKEHAHGELVLSWKNLNVSVKQTTEKLFGKSTTTHTRILTNISGNVRCGTLLAIMGPSGSGKTTLMSTISHRTKGNFDGELLLNGKPVSEDMMIKMSGFVPQQDISFDQMTAFEHLFLMANLKMDRRASESERRENVERTVRALAMDAFLNSRISLLSGGERKKTALAVQLLDDPPILFCDEITTGLDSYSAANIVKTLRSVARTGKIVVCTIHQPSSGVFGKFDEVVLLTEGRLAYQGPVSLVNDFFKKFRYECPNMFNEADYVISVLNSDDETDKKSIDEMCKASSSESQMNINYDLFNNEKQLSSYEQQTQKPLWTTYFSLIFDRSIKCFLRSYNTKLVELATVLFLAVMLSLPYSTIKFDTKAVQNWEGFWLMFASNFIYHCSFSSIAIYQVKFSVVHREVHNKVYPLSAYYVSEIVISIIWLVTKMLFYCVTAFVIVGAETVYGQYLVFLLVGLTSFSYGLLLTSYFSDIESSMIFITIYNSVAMYLSGAYLSIASLSNWLYSLRFLSVFFLASETVSVTFWSGIKSLPCIDVKNCLESGEAVLRSYGYISSEFNIDVLIMATFCVVSIIYSYLGVLKKMKKQPAY